MTFADIPAGLAVFLDANTLIYHFTFHPTFGQPCTDLLARAENQEIQASMSAHALSEMAHRLMTIEAASLNGWPMQGIAHRLKNHPAEIQRLARARQAIDETSLFGIHVLPVTRSEVSLAADFSRQHGLLAADALIVAVMRSAGLTHLASNDADFDRVPGLTRYAPV